MRSFTKMPCGSLKKTFNYSEGSVKYILLLAIVLCAIGNNVMKNSFAKGSGFTDGDNAVYNIIACFIGAPMALIGHEIQPVSWQAFSLALLFGASMAGVAITTILALKSGPMALTVLFGNFSLLIPLLAGFVLWREAATVRKMIGIALIFASVFLILSPGRNEKGSKKWAFMTLLYFLSSGMMSLFQQLASKCCQDEASMFLVCGFLAASFFLLLYTVFFCRSGETRPHFPLFSLENLNGLIVGVFGGISHICALKILTLMDSTVFYPLKDGLCIVFNALVGLLFFHERFSNKKTIGFVLGASAILLLSVGA